MYGLDYRGYCRFGRVNMRLFRYEYFPSSSPTRDQKNLVKQSSVYHSNYGLLLSLSPFYSSKIYDYLSEANVYLKVDYRDLLPYRVPGAPKYQYKTSLTYDSLPVSWECRMQNECRPSTRSALGVQLAYGTSCGSPLMPRFVGWWHRSHHGSEDRSEMCMFPVDWRRDPRKSLVCWETVMMSKWSLSSPSSSPSRPPTGTVASPSMWRPPSASFVPSLVKEPSAILIGSSVVWTCES